MNTARRTKAIALSGLLTALALTISGCQATPSNVAYGMVWGTGEKVSTSTGSYEQYKVADQTVFWNEVVSGAKSVAGGNFPPSWTEDDLIGGLRYSVDYLTTQVLDSPALEGGDQEYRQWLETTAKNYFDEATYARLATGGKVVVVGKLGDQIYVPELIHDGKPRVAGATVRTVSAAPAVAEADGQEYVTYGLTYGADFRVTDANAAAIAARHATNGPITAEQLINSPQAKEQLKDGKGENIYRMTGTANISVTKNAQGEFKLVGFTLDDAKFSTLDYTTE